MRAAPVDRRRRRRVTRPPRILSLGWDEPFTCACLSRDFEVVVVHDHGEWDWGRVGTVSPTETILVDDRRDVEAVLAAVVRRGGRETFTSVVAHQEWAITAGSLVAAALGTRGLPTLTALRFRDKAIQKAAIAEAGIPVARFCVLGDIHAVAKNGPPEQWALWPAVAKPIAGASAASTAVCADEAELVEFARSTLAGSHRPFSRRVERMFLLEEFIEGAEWYIDGVVEGGEIAFLSIGTYVVGPRDTKRGDVLRTRKLDPHEEASTYATTTGFARRCLQALGLSSGVFHLEAFLPPGATCPVFGECAARIGGGTTREEVQVKFNVDLADAAAVLAGGASLQIQPDVLAESVGATYLPSPPGVLLTAPTDEEVAAREGVVLATVEVPVGLTMPDMRLSTVCKAGEAVLTAPSDAELSHRMDRLVTWFASQVLVAPANATPRELREREREWRSRTAGRDAPRDTLVAAKQQPEA